MMRLFVAFFGSSTASAVGHVDVGRRWLGTMGAMLVGGLLWGGLVMGEELSFSFNEKLLDDPQFMVGYDASFLEISDDSLRVNWVGKDAAMTGFSAKTRFVIAGDFTVDYRFKPAVIGQPLQGWGSGVLLRLDFNDWSRTGLSVQRQCTRQGQQLINIDQTTRGQDEHEVQLFPVEPDQEIDGIRMQRSGQTLIVSTLKDKQVVTRYEPLSVSDAEVYPVGFHVHSGESPGDLDITLRGGTITADRFLSPEELSPVSVGSKSMIAVAVLLIVVGAGGWRFFSRKVGKTNSRTEAQSHGDVQEGSMG